ncbi:hypothetical protein [Dictyobacter kobayashii]|uniref:Alpha/beta hydrolase n=1 Tax=Dictyobacter kobayashii TaxID=2014872 RepID=A0A402APJ5_9CHLR|nr:hypothetical protein [Dictyobacter kobayashii]GCE20974.1 hypothetical protein KDK_47740 [Dictyobacter kobayashii]
MARQLHAAGQQVALLALFDSDYPAPGLRKLFRKVIVASCQALKQGPEKPLEWFLQIRHLYRLLRFSRYRHEKVAEHQARQQGDKVEAQLARPVLTILPRAVIFPTANILREDWPGIYEWMGLGYYPTDLYPGKIVFFWDEVDLWRRAGWRTIVASKNDQVETHILRGSHHSCRTDYLDGFVATLHSSLQAAQKSVSVRV